MYRHGHLHILPADTHTHVRTHTRHNFQGSIVLENEQTQLIFKMIDRNYLVALLVTKVVFVFFGFCCCCCFENILHAVCGYRKGRAGAI